MFKRIFTSSNYWGRALVGLALLAGPLAALAQPTSYCIPLAVCARADIYEVSITNTTLSNRSYLPAPCTTPYTLWPPSGKTTAYLTPLTTYQFNVTTSDGYLFYSQSTISLWIDWNQNGTFDASEWTQVASAANAFYPNTVRVLVPLEALPGRTRMRVRTRLINNPHGPGDACTAFGGGETEDYIVSIGPPQACDAPINLGVSNVTTTSATLTYSPGTSTIGVSYVVEYGPLGFVPGSAGSTTVNTISNSAPLTGLTPSTNYEFYATKSCGGGASSFRDGPFRFRTAALPRTYATLPYLQDFENPWVNGTDDNDVPDIHWLNMPATRNLSWRRDDDTTSAHWQYRTSGTFVLGAGQGQYTARFHDYAAGLNSPGQRGRFDLYVNLSNPGPNVLQFDYINRTGRDSLQVQLSTDGGLTFGVPLLRLNNVPAWTTQLLNLPATNSATCVLRFQGQSGIAGGADDIGLDNVRAAANMGVPGCVTTAVPANGATGVTRPVTLAWQQGTGVATGYDVYFGTSASALALVSSNQTGTSYYIPTNLASNTAYYYQVVPRNASGPATGCTVLSFTTGAGLVYCETNLGGLCLAGGASISGVAIAGTTLNNLNNGCNIVGGTFPNGNAYIMWPASGRTTAALIPGNPYQMSVTTVSAAIISVWGDWNQNGLFEANEWTQIATASPANSPATMTLNVPATALAGQIRLRVRSRSSGAQNGAGDACTYMGSGETEDYVVTIGSPPACAPPVNLAISNLAASSATFTFSGASSGTATGYVVQYGVAGFMPGSAGGTTLTTTTTTLPLAGLAPGTMYHLYVTKNCGGGASSQPNGPLVFTTPIVNDNPCTATVLTINNTCQPTNGSLLGATVVNSNVFAGGSAGIGCGPNTNGQLDVWYQFTTAATGPTSTAMRIIVTGGAASAVRAYVGPACTGPLNFIGCAGTASNIAAPALDLTALTPSTTYYVRVHTYTSFDALGSFTICATPVPNCLAPNSLAVGTLTGTTAQLSWSGTGTAGSTFTVIYGPVSFNPATGGTSVTGIGSTSTTLTGLSQTTVYDFYVQQVCGGSNGGSVLVGPVSFTTLVALPGNDEPCGAVALGNSPVSSTNLGATTSVQAGISLPACAPSQTPKDVWFAFTSTSSGISLTLTGTAVGMVRLYTLTDCTNGPLVQVGCQAAAGPNVGFPAPVVFTGLTPGQLYYVTISGYSSSDTGGPFTVAATSVLASRPATVGAALLAYPNPSNTGQLTLRLASNAPAQLALFNALGQVVRRQALAAGSGEHSFGTRGLAAGVYILQVQAGSETLTRKVVVE